MKKIALFICTLILAAAVAFAVSADDAKFTVELTGPEVVNAGKTTLTEKLLLYGGAIRQAGSVKARKAERYDGTQRLDGD